MSGYDDTLLDASGEETLPGAVDPETEPPGQIGRFEVKHSIGAGGMGAVFACHDPVLRREVAIKLLNVAASTDARKSRKRMEREARILATLDHPNIVRFYDVGEHGDSLYFAMELSEGTPLDVWARQHRPDPQTVASIGGQIARALAAAHAIGVVHRDIKPKNILIERDGRVRVLDFGVARRIEAFEGPASTESDLTRSGELVGTLLYMAPEQLRADSVSEASDLFSLGLLLYELLAGKRAFGGRNATEVAVATLTQTAPPLPEHVPAAFVDLVERLLAKNPANRPAGAEVVAEELDAIAAGNSTRSSRSGPNVTILAAGIVAILAVLGLVLWLNLN